MKAELIADWRLRIADRTLITLRVTDIGRILEERERLLEALRSAVDEMGVAIGAPTMWTDAIAFAESE